MRIVVHGQQAFGKAVLEALLKRGDNDIAVYVAPEKPGAKPDPLKEAAQAAGLPVYQPASYRKPEVWEEFRALKPDLQVMAFVTLFVPEEFLNIPTHGSIQYHPSLLPAYRGASAINWPIILGEKETGLSIFWPDNGLDTGDVLLQKKTPLSATDTMGDVYFKRLFPMGVDAMLESVDLVKAGKAPRIKQDESKATYEGRATADIARIDWGKSWRQIDPLVRGCNPVPGAWTTLDGKQLQVFEVTPIPAKDPKGIGGKYGEVVEVSADGFTVVTVALDEVAAADALPGVEVDVAVAGVLAVVPGGVGHGGRERGGAVGHLQPHAPHGVADVAAQVGGVRHLHLDRFVPALLVVQRLGDHAIAAGAAETAAAVDRKF